MTTALHAWLNHAQETTRFDSVTGKYGLLVDTPSGMSQNGQNALRFLRSLSEHSPTFFDSHAKLLSPPTPELIPDLPASPLATPMSMSMSGPQRTARRPSRMPRSPYAPDTDGLFAFDMPPDEPTYVPNFAATRKPASSRSRPYPACRAYTSPTTSHADLSRSPPPLGSGYFPPAPEPSPALDMFTQQHGWDKGYSGAVPTPNINTQVQNYQSYASPPASYAPSPSASSFTSAQSYPFYHSQFSPTTQQQEQYQDPEMDVQHCGDDADRARMSALMYGSMRARTVVAASEADGQGW
ncbi:hypothetical protein RhiJN_12374 [Ceratobasidium sp. AG-Ba]|nr:hypothetical protein RhiJN_12374 [Ceratobasidium sp. AG-Ba]QRW12978.1 hypothetical protein RhiLY_11977 [Ceratobasidium sp. AG-Ba]